MTLEFQLHLIASLWNLSHLTQLADHVVLFNFTSGNMILCNTCLAQSRCKQPWYHIESWSQHIWWRIHMNINIFSFHRCYKIFLVFQGFSVFITYPGCYSSSLPCIYYLSIWPSQSILHQPLLVYSMSPSQPASSPVNKCDHKKSLRPFINVICIDYKLLRLSTDPIWTSILYFATLKILTMFSIRLLLSM